MSNFAVVIMNASSRGCYCFQSPLSVGNPSQNPSDVSAVVLTCVPVGCWVSLINFRSLISLDLTNICSIVHFYRVYKFIKNLAPQFKIWPRIHGRGCCLQPSWRLYFSFHDLDCLLMGILSHQFGT